MTPELEAYLTKHAGKPVPCVAVPKSLYRAVIARMVKQRNSSTDLGLIRQLEALDPELTHERNGE